MLDALVYTWIRIEIENNYEDLEFSNFMTCGLRSTMLNLRKVHPLSLHMKAEHTSFCLVFVSNQVFLESREASLLQGKIKQNNQ